MFTSRTLPHVGPATQRRERAQAIRDRAKVYLIECRQTDLVKIGSSVVPRKRFDSIRTTCSTDTRLICFCPGGREYERELHERFREKHSHGEWFSLSKAELKDLQAEMDRKRWNKIGGGRS